MLIPAIFSKLTGATVLALLFFCGSTTYVAAQSQDPNPGASGPLFYSNQNPYYRVGLQGQCTWYVWGRCAQAGWALNAAPGADNEYNNGVITNGGGKGNLPQPGAIMCLSYTYLDANKHLVTGYHVAYVFYVDASQTSWKIAQWNVPIKSGYSTYAVTCPTRGSTSLTGTFGTGTKQTLIGFLYPPHPLLDKKPPLGAIDQPYQSGLTVSGSATIVGWANDGHGQQTNLQSVQLLLDGSSMGQVSYPVKRSDGQLGFQLVWDTTKTSDGSHTITLHLVSKAGVTFDLSRTVIVSNVVSPLHLPSTISNNQYLWAGQSLASDNSRFVLTMQYDGNLVLYARSPSGERPIWASNTQGVSGARAVMQSDGNFVVYNPNWQPVWASGTGVWGSYLIVQDDGNLVVYTSGGSPVWASNTRQ